MSDLKIFLLGTPRIELRGKPAQIDRKKALALLAYLAVTERVHYREWLATMLWPESSTGRTQVRIALSSLRNALGDEWLISNRDDIGLSKSAWVDVQQFRRLDNQLRHQSLPISQRNALLDEAILLYEQDFLEGFNLRDAPQFDQWQRIEEQGLRNIYERCLHERIKYCISHRQFGVAETLARRLIQLDPLDETARRYLMCLYVWTDRRQQAIREYDDLSSLLSTTLGLEPEQETQLIRSAIQRNQDIPTPVQSMPALAQQAHDHSFQIPAFGPLIGRKQEILTLIQLLDQGSRLITLTGPSGIGKTHLAVALANRIKEHYHDGSYFIRIETETPVASFVATLLQALGLYGPLPGNDRNLLKASLMGKKVLFVIDNFQHIHSGKNLIHEILQLAPDVAFLLTSYEPLNLINEHCIPLGGLEVGTPEDTGADAQHLYLHRAKHIRPDFALAPEDHVAVKQICTLLGGMPLGIILAAAWSDVLTPDDILQQIETDYAFLDIDSDDLPERHQSIRAVFNTTWMQQSQIERQALMRLSVFQGGFTHQAADTVAHVSLGILKRFAAKSLLYHDVQRNRYTFHDLLRRYILDKAKDAGDLDSFLLDHARFFASLVARHESAIKGHLQNTVWQKFDNELGNIIAAWNYLLQDKQFEEMIPMIEPFRIFLQAKGSWDQGISLFEELRDQTASLRSLGAQRVHLKATSRLYFRGEQTQSLLVTALETAKQLDDAAEVAHILAELGWYWLEESHYSQAKSDFEKAVDLFLEHEDFFNSALALRGLAYSAIGLSDLAGATEYMRHSLHQRRTIGDWLGEHETLLLRGEISLIKGYVRAALHDFKQAFAYYSNTFSEQAAYLRCIDLVWAYTFNADYKNAIEIAEELLTHAPAHTMSPVRATAIAALALIHFLKNDRSVAYLYAEELETLLKIEFQWPSKLNPDSRFFIDLTHCIVNQALGGVQPTKGTLSRIIKGPTYISSDHLMWMCPVIILLSVHNDMPEAANELARVFIRSEVASLPWTSDWAELQEHLQNLNSSPPRFTESQSNPIVHTIRAVISELTASD